MKSVHNLAQLLVSCWRLSGEELIPTSHGILDQALARAVKQDAFPPWARDHLNFSDSRIGLQCVELPMILDWAQKSQLTAAPNPSYRTVRVLVSERAASKLLKRLSVSEDEAKQLGEALRNAVDEIKGATAPSESPASLEY